VNGIPTLEEVRAWIAVPATSLPDDDLQQILNAEIEIQARTCRIPEDSAEAVYPPALARALLRRCQRQVAARNVPLGVLGAEGAEFGPLNLPRWDAEVGRLEASYRIVVVA
jgi:hypothetical protein